MRSLVAVFGLCAIAVPAHAQTPQLNCLRSVSGLFEPIRSIQLRACLARAGGMGFRPQAPLVPPNFAGGGTILVPPVGQGTPYAHPPSTNGSYAQQPLQRPQQQAQQQPPQRQPTPSRPAPHPPTQPATTTAAAAKTTLASRGTASQADCAGEGPPRQRVVACTELLADVDKLTPLQHRDILFWRAGAYLALGATERDREIADLEEGLGIEKTSLTSHSWVEYNALGRAYESKNDLQRAIAAYSQAAANNPTWPVAFNNRGWALRRTRDLAGAEKDFDTALSLDAKLVPSLTGRGLIRMERANYPGAIDDLSAVLRTDASALNYLYRGTAYLRASQDVNAISDLTAAIKLDSQLAVAFLNRSIAYKRIGQNDDAMSDLNEAVRLKPGFVEARVTRAQANLDAGKAAGAVEDASEALRLAPRDETALLIRARAQFALEAFDLALVDFDAALRLKPDDDVAKAGRAAVMAKLYPQAVASSTGAAGTAPDNGKPSGASPPVISASATGDASHGPPNDQVAAGKPAQGSNGTPSSGASTTASTGGTAQPPVVSTVAFGPDAGALPSSLEPHRRVALVIGNGAYAYANKLPNPPNDASDFAKSLRGLGFEVIEGEDLDVNQMKVKLHEFADRLEGADAALFFYAGHGIQVDGRNYLVPVDAKLNNVGDLDLDAVDISIVMRAMDSENRVSLVFLDACRNNPFTQVLSRSMASRGFSPVGQGLAPIRTSPGTMINFSTEPNQVAQDGEGRNSPFTSALLKEIGSPGMDIELIMKRVRHDVLIATHNQQAPRTDSGLTVDVVLKTASSDTTATTAVR